MSRRYTFVVMTMLVFLLGACASRGPVAPTPPTVQVTQFDPTVITPEVIKFQAKIVIHNRMRAGLNIEKVDYGADVHDTPVFIESFAELHPMKGNGNQTVTFPFQIAMKDIAKQAVDVLAEEALRVSFRGEVFPVGFDPVPFQATRTIPLPKPPLVSLESADYYGKIFTVVLRIQNTNSFPMALKSVDSYMEINGKRYSLLRTQGITEINPGAAEKIALTMEQTTGKALSVILNVAMAKSFEFNIGGSFSCQTPYGLVYMPLDLKGEAR